MFKKIMFRPHLDISRGVFGLPSKNKNLKLYTTDCSQLYQEYIFLLFTIQHVLTWKYCLTTLGHKTIPQEILLYILYFLNNKN